MRYLQIQYEQLYDGWSNKIIIQHSESFMEILHKKILGVSVCAKFFELCQLIRTLILLVKKNIVFEVK